MGLVDLSYGPFGHPSYGPFGHPSYGPFGHHPNSPVNSGGCHPTESYYSLHLSSTPSSTARTAACVRSETPSLQMTLRTCFLTVLTLIRSFRAICWFA